MMRYLITSLMLICGMPAASAAAELTGTVRSQSGEPLAGVVVSSRCRGAAETDAAGSFKLRSPSLPSLDGCGQVVFFWAAGFLPQIKIVDEATREVHVVLAESAGHGRVIPFCSDMHAHGRRLGWTLRVPSPRGASVRQGKVGLHGSGFRIRVRGKGKRIEVSGYGGQYADGYPSDDLILTAAEYTIRPWRAGREEGVDFRGRSADGARWRYFAVFGEEVQYSAATDEEAPVLDSIIDGACFQPPSNE